MSKMYDTLKALCDEKGITITDMCREANIPRSSVGNLATGSTQQLSSKNVSKAAVYFGVSTDYILGNTDTKKIPAVTVYDEDDNVIRLDDETLELIDSLRTKPEMKILFSVAKGATKEDIIKTVKIIEALKDGGSKE